MSTIKIKQVKRDVYKRQVLESMDFPEPVIGIAVEPKTQKDMDKLSNGLAKLAEEDPTFTVKTCLLYTSRCV